MSQDIILKRELKTETWLIQAEVARAGSRPEINCVLQFLSENPGSNAAQCSEHLFGDSTVRSVVAERLLNLARSYKLVDSRRDKYQLSDAGKAALKKDEILIPEDGCWEICICNEPLLPHHILSIKEHNEPRAAITGLHKNRENLHKRSKKLIDVPKTVTATQGLQAEPISGGKEVRIDKIKSKGERITPEGKNLQVVWNTTEGVVEVKKGKELIFTCEVKPISRHRALRGLLDDEGLLEQWNEQTRTLAVTFNNTTEPERISMKRALKVKKPSVRNYGDFNAVTLPNISVSALSNIDMKEWAKWRLKNSINTYASSNKYGAWREKALTPFSDFDCALPSRDELANEVWYENRQQSQYTWHVIAAHDWNL